MKKHIIVSFFLLSFFPAWGEDHPKLFSGNASGLYYGLGTALCDILDCDNTPSNGSLDNINLLKQNNNSLAIIQLNCLNEHQAELITLKTLYTEAYTLAVKADSNIFTIKDLQGKRTNIDKINSGSYTSAIDLFNNYSFKKEDLGSIYNLPINKDLNKLCENKIDASFHVVAHPNVNFQSLNCALRFIPIDDDIALKLVNKNKFLKFTEIKSGLYNFDYKSTRTIGVSAVLVANKNIDKILLKNIKNKLDASYDKLKLKYLKLTGIELSNN